jgi:hypothetical protein
MQADERAYMRASITNAWVKLDQYYTLLGHSPLFAAAVILHPGHGLRFLEQIWADQAQWLSDAKKSLKLYFERWYLDPNDPSDPFSPSPSPGPQQQHPPKEATAFEQWVKNLRPRASEIDSELERYYRLEPQTVNDPIQWWVDHRETFPQLSCFALDLLAIPAMASDCERAFSLAKLIMTSQRHGLLDGRMEDLQLLKNWLRHGSIGLGNIWLS